jgi:hypothetical protein
MKIKDCKDLNNIKVKTPKGVIGYWRSQWDNGVWLSDGKSDRIYPQFVDSLKDCLEWDIAEEKEKVNCHKRTDFHSIDNCKEKNNE